MQARALLTDMFGAAVEAADPYRILPNHLPAKPKGRTIVIGAGKGAAQLARAFESLWDGPLSGVVVTRYGYAVPCERIRVIEANHPTPDDAGLRAGQALLGAVSGLTEDDLVVALICGGGSALLPAPPAGYALADEHVLNTALLASGAPIGVMNALRRQFSTLKGGRLAAAAHPARVVSLIVSDVPGDAAADVASGPTVADPDPACDPKALIDAYRIAIPDRVLAGFSPGPAHLPHTQSHIIGSPRKSLVAAQRLCEARGIQAVLLSDAIEGEARDIGRMHAAMAREIALHDAPFARPVVVLSGGETTVTLTDQSGRGGRNTELALSFALDIDGMAITGLMADTDGIDGSQTNAGAFVDGQSAARMRRAGVDPLITLRQHDSWAAFDAIGDLFEPGPTGTNVNDFRAIYIGD